MERKLITLVWCQDTDGTDLIAEAPAFEKFYAEDHAVVCGEMVNVVDSCQIFTDDELFLFLKPFIEVVCGVMDRVEAKLVFQKMEYREEAKDEAAEDD